MTAMNKPLFVAMEGMDGCGKSTIGAVLAKQLGAELIKTPPDSASFFRKEMDCGDGFAAQLFYASAVINASAAAQKTIAAGRNAVIDRYAASTIAYDGVSRKSGRPDDFWANDIFSVIVAPDVVFYLETDKKIRESRMAKRQNLGATDKDSIVKKQKLSERYNRAFSLFAKRGWQVCHIPNNETPNACIAKCLAEINNLCK